MKKTICLLTVMFIIPFCVPGSAFCIEWTGNLNFLLGAKQLDEDDWEPLEDHAEFAVMADFKNKSWPISIAIDSFGSYDEEDYYDRDIEGSTGELCFGIRKIWEPDAYMRPFIGGGIALVTAELESLDNVDDDDSAFGLWIGGGVYWTLSGHFNIGLLVKYSKAEVTLFDTDYEAGGSHFGIMLGYHW